MARPRRRPIVDSGQVIVQVLMGSRRWRAIVKPFWKAYRLWDREDCVDLSAAFAYHSLQSFFPILLIA